jgi:hypothetical protein
MAGLLSAIPGLASHAVVVPETAPVFDICRADTLLYDLNGKVGAAYPGAECFPWLTANRPEVWTALCEGENDVDRAYLQQDMAALEPAIDRLWRMYQKAFGIYEARPPIVEVQGVLL